MTYLGQAPAAPLKYLNRVTFQIPGGPIPILTRGIRNAVRYGKQVSARTGGSVQLLAIKDAYGHLLAAPVVVATVQGRSVVYGGGMAGLGVAPTMPIKFLNRVVFKVTSETNPIPVLTRGIRNAVRYAKSMAARGGTAQISAVKDAYGHALDQPLLIATVAGRTVTYAMSGLGDVLTDIACDSTTFAQNWKTRLNDTISTGGQAALLGGGVAGLIGALMGRPIVGMIIGAGAAWTAHAIWTAPLAPSA